MSRDLPKEFWDRLRAFIIHTVRRMPPPIQPAVVTAVDALAYTVDVSIGAGTGALAGVPFHCPEPRVGDTVYVYDLGGSHVVLAGGPGART